MGLVLGLGEDELRSAEHGSIGAVLGDEQSALAARDARALGVLAASHTFGVHTGWQDPSTAKPIAETAALAVVGIYGDRSRGWRMRSDQVGRWPA